MEGLALSDLGVVGGLAALALGMVLWKLFKLGLKIVIFIVGTALIAVVVVMAAQHGGAALPLPAISGPPPP